MGCQLLLFPDNLAAVLQIIALRHQGDEIQAQSLGRGQDAQAHVRRAGVDFHRHGHVGVLFPRLALNARRIVVLFEEMVQIGGIVHRSTILTYLVDQFLGSRPYQKFDGFLAQEQEEITPDKLFSGAKKCSHSAPTKKNR